MIDCVRVVALWLDACPFRLMVPNPPWPLELSSNSAFLIAVLPAPVKSSKPV